jgi:hypothetical protein
MISLKDLSDEKLIEYYNLYKKTKKASKRAERVKIHGMDSKFGYHLVRLMYEVEEILTTGDLHLDQNTEVLKAIRRGEWSQERVEKFFEQKEHALNEAYEKSQLPYGPREKEIKELLLRCLEHHFGSLKDVYVEPDRYKNAVMNIMETCTNVLKGG